MYSLCALDKIFGTGRIYIQEMKLFFAPLWVKSAHKEGKNGRLEVKTTKRSKIEKQKRVRLCFKL